MEISNSSLRLKWLKGLVQSGRLKRGYWRVLTHLPFWIWGGRIVRVDTVVGEMVVPLDDAGSSGLVFWGNVPHEIHETRLIQRLAKSCRVMVDVGAHLGWYTRLMRQSIPSGGQIYAFEPNPRVYPYLVENTRDYEEVFVYQIALGDSKHAITLYCADSSNLSSTVRNVGQPISVTGMALDDILRPMNLIGQIDFIKCDVEGGEIAVLHGARQIRAHSRSPIWMIEVDNDFLGESGNSLEHLHSEILNGPPIYLFCYDQNGQIREIKHLQEHEATPNIFIVPENRLSQFKMVA